MIEFRVLTGQQGLILSDHDLCEALDEILGRHIAQFDGLHGFKTLNATNAMLPENPAFAHFLTSARTIRSPARRAEIPHWPTAARFVNRAQIPAPFWPDPERW